MQDVEGAASDLETAWKKMQNGQQIEPRLSGIGLMGFWIIDTYQSELVL